MISAESLNRMYGASGGRLAPGESDRPQVWLAIVTCMDHRLRPQRSLGVATGDAHVIRNAGGRVSDDALRSLMIAWSLLGVNEFVVIHHTGCRMMTFTDEQLRHDLHQKFGIDASEVEFLPFTDLGSSVRADVERIRKSPFIPDHIAVSGFVCNTKNGHLEQIVADPRSEIPPARPRPAALVSPSAQTPNPQRRRRRI